MTGLGIQAWVLSLIGIRAALSHRECLEILEVLRILGNSYRLASLGAGSIVIYGRFTFDFCMIIAACTARNIASRQFVQQAIGSIPIRSVTANVGPRGRRPVSPTCTICGFSKERAGAPAGQSFASQADQFCVVESERGEPGSFSSSLAVMSKRVSKPSLNRE